MNSEPTVQSEADFYAVLNVSPNANEEEIRVAYKRLCVVFHPDKHTSVAERRTAEAAFQRIRAAYDVLSNPESRALYDVFGSKSLEFKMEMVPSRKHVKELRDEYERIWLKEKELKKLRELSPSTTLEMGMNISHIVDPSSTELQNPPILTEVSLRQSKQYRVMTDTDVTTSASVSAVNGVGIANFALSFAKVLNEKFVLSLNFNLSNLMFHPLDNRQRAPPACIYCTNPLEPEDRLPTASMALNLPKLRPSHAHCSFALQHNVSPSLSQTIELGRISSDNILPTDVGYSLMYKTAPVQLATSFVIGKFNKVFNFQMRYSFKQFEFRGAFRFSSLDALSLTYGATRFSNDKMSMSGFELSVSSSSVFILFRYYIGKRKFLVPVTISQSFSFPVVFYSTLFPVLAGVAWDSVLSRPFSWIKSKIEFGFEQERSAKKQAEDEQEVDKKRRAAEKETNLIKSQAARITEQEKKKNGLVIQRAWYGQFDENEDYPTLSSVCYSVATQLQLCVNQSKLILNQGQSKSHLAGFFDPCPGQVKKLKVVYLFKGELHEAVFADLDPVRLPKMSHRMD